MKKKLRGVLFAASAFLILAYLYPGFAFANPKSILLAAGLFSLFYLFVRPFLRLLSLPLNLITFGVFSLFVNVILLYALSYVVTDFSIVAFQFSGLSSAGILLPQFYVSSFFSALTASFLLSLLVSAFYWLFS